MNTRNGYYCHWSQVAERQQSNNMALFESSREPPIACAFFAVTLHLFNHSCVPNCVLDHRPIYYEPFGKLDSVEEDLPSAVIPLVDFCFGCQVHQHMQ